MFELYGSFNENTGEWADGLVAILVREAVQDQTPMKKWVNFDGPVDAIWIENMNTVLDDNKMLCLANGERIKLAPTMTMMFEVGDLAVASPATVSRCGMVYMEYVHLGWQSLIHTWKENFINELPAFAVNIHKWVLMLCETCLPFIRESCTEAPGIPSYDVTLVHSFLKLINTYICLRNGIPRTSDEAKSNKTDAQQDKLVRMFVLYSLFWSLGGNLHDNSRTKFQNFVKPKLKTFCPDFPEHDDLYQLAVDCDACQFVRVQEIVPDFTYDPDVPFFNLVVPTVESTIQQSLLENISSGGYNILMAGETGIGKTVGIMSFLNTCGESYTTATANFSAQTSSSNVVDMFESKMERKRKNLLGPPAGTRMVIFVDDVNMPMLETYSAAADRVAAPGCRPRRLLRPEEGRTFQGRRGYAVHYILRTSRGREDACYPTLLPPLQHDLDDELVRGSDAQDLQLHSRGLGCDSPPRTGTICHADGTDRGGGFLPHHRGPPADAGEVPLHLQPPRPGEDRTGNPPGEQAVDAGQEGGPQGTVREAFCTRDVPPVPRPFDGRHGP
jgi:hypothetical protein